MTTATLRTDRVGALPFMGISFLVAFGLATVVLLVSGTDTEAINRALRITARFSFLLFWCAYAGGSLAKATGRFRDLARHGREFGLAFAAAHLVHLGLVAWLYQISSTPPLSAKLAVFFGIGVFWTYILALFSIPNMTTALSPPIWRLLRLIGLEYIMLAFQWDFVLGLLHINAKTLIVYLPFAMAGVAGTALRFWVWAKSSPSRVNTIGTAPTKV